MAVGIYAGSTIEGMTALPSPTDLDTSREIIWSEDTGRAQSGENKAKMIGNVVDTKRTYAIKWAILNSISGDKDSLQKVTSLLTPGFFYFGVGTSLADAQNNAAKYYRSEIQYSYLPIGSHTYFKDVTVSVIEQ
jgi:hypothetical protein